MFLLENYIVDNNCKWNVLLIVIFYKIYKFVILKKMLYKIFFLDLVESKIVVLDKEL